MSYIEDEVAGLDPVELYEFTFGAETWRFTDSDGVYDHPITTDEYTPEPITRGSLEQSNEDGSMSVEVTVDARNPIADFFRTPFLTSRHVWLTIFRTHRGSVATPGTVFRGVVTQCQFSEAQATLMCVPMRHVIGRKIPVQLVQRVCTNTLYDGRCKVVPADYDFVATILTVEGLVLTMDYVDTGQVAGFYDGGFIEKAGVPPATIKVDIPGTLEIMYNPGYANGDVITMYPGCDKKLLTCQDKFDNDLHFQGFPFMPLLDPFSSEIK